MQFRTPAIDQLAEEIVAHTSTTGHPPSHVQVSARAMDCLRAELSYLYDAPMGTPAKVGDQIILMNATIGVQWPRGFCIVAA